MIAVVRTHWWLSSYSSYSSQTLEGYKLKAECLFLTGQKRKKREREREPQNSTPVIAGGRSYSTKLIIFLDTEPFVISTDELFQVDAYF